MEPSPTPRAKALAARLQEAAHHLLDVVEQIGDRHWRHVPNPGVWSISKDAEHVADATAMHQWIVRRTVGEKVPSRRPAIERGQLVSDGSPSEVAALIRERTDEGARLLIGLTDEQLDSPTRPPRARNQRLVETIELVLIDHYDGHRQEIEAKLRALRDVEDE